MKYMTDEMMEDLAEKLRADEIDCKTVHEWIAGAKQKTRKIEDHEIRKIGIHSINNYF